MDRNLHVVYASDDRFAEILGVSLTSLYENNKDMSAIHVYILDSRISADNKGKLTSLSREYGRAPIKWIQAKDISQELHMNVAVDRGSLSQYARLFVSSILPADLERVLYLDCDTIVCQSLAGLWNLDLRGRTVAALKEVLSKWYRMNIGLKPDDIMFNSGVMLIDLKRWKELQIEKKLLEFISSREGNVQQGDQGALNAVLSYETYCFEPKYNSVTLYYDFTYKEIWLYRKPAEFYSEAQIKEAVENPVIIHFTTSFLSRRPWFEGCQHRYVGEWLKYRGLSPWEDKPLWKYRKAAGAKGAGVAVAGILPRRLMIWLTGIAHAYARPALNKIRK